MALISGGVYVLPSASFTLIPSEFASFSTLYGTSSRERLVSGSSKRRPMKRLIEKTVLPGFVTAWRLASWPTSRSPVLVKATTDGIVRPPSADAMTVGSPPSMTATTEFVVPRSMPMILPMSKVLLGVRGSVLDVGGGGARRGGRRHGDECGSDDAIAQPVAAPDLLDDLAFGSVGAGD